MKRIESIYNSPNDGLSEVCHLSKNLYNEANYIVRQEFISTGKWTRYYALCKALKDSENYTSLPAQTAQQVLRGVDHAWKSFFGAIKEWKAHPEKFIGRPGLPHYLDKDGEYVLSFTNQQVRIKDGTLKLPKKIGLEVRTRLPDNTKLRGARIVPQGVGYQVEIIYEKETPEPRKSKPKRIAGIDLGVNNLVTIGTNIGGIEPIVVKGGLVKSWNQFYNKEKAKLQSVYDHQGIKDGFGMEKLAMKRKFKLRDYFHKTSRAIIDWCVKNKIDTIVIGHNKGWKQDINIGARNNQNFVSIPFDMLRKQLAYKAEEHRILPVDSNEDHTSKCSFLDGESVEHHDKYMGRRIKRGLFRASDGRTINADLNAAYNIIRKAFPKAFAKGIEGLGMAPRRLNV